MRDFIDLIPALNDPTHLDHGRALEAFPKSTTFLFLQWLLTEKAHLSTSDAERFFGGNEGDPEAQLIVAAIRKDRNGFEELYQRLVGPRPNRSAVMFWPETARRLEDSKAVLYAWLRNRLLDIAPPEHQTDLRPANATPLLQSLRSARSSSNKRERSESKKSAPDR